MNRLSFLALLTGAPVARGETPVVAKLNQIESGKAKRGSTIVFTKQEIDEHIRQELRAKQVKGLSAPVLALGTARASGTAQVDFSLLKQQTTGKPPGMLSRLLLSGDRELEVDIRVSSAPQYCRVDILNVSVDGFDVSGRALDWMIANYLKPRYPQVKLNEWFALQKGIERIDVSPFDVRVKMLA